MLAATTTILMTLFSNPGERMAAFVQRIAPQANQITASSNAEVCGALGRADDGQRYTIVLQTSNQHLECTIDKVAGKFTGYTFHTHPADGAPGWGAGDKNLKGWLSTPTKIYYKDPMTKRQWDL